MHKEDSNVFKIGVGEIGVAQMVRGTTDSRFVLVRGVASNSDRRIDEFLWEDVSIGGEVVALTKDGNNPTTIAIPGTYKFRNDGTDDEQALIDVEVYKERG